MYAMYRNEKFSNLVYLELGLNFQILFRSPCSLPAWQSQRSQTNDAPSVYAVPHYWPAAKH